MEQKKRSNFTFVLVALGAVVLASTLFTTVPRGCGQQTAAIPELSEKDKAAYRDYIVSQYHTPATFIVDAFNEHELVYLGDSFSRNNFDVVRAALPDLHRRGVETIGVEFVLSTDQADVDALLTAAVYDNAKARDILSNHFGFFTYQESLDLFKVVWTFNHGLKRGVRPMRIIGLGLRIDMAVLAKPENRDNKELQKKALGGITYDEAYFQVINAEIIQKKKRALIYMNMYSSLKNTNIKALVEAYQAIGITYRGTTATLTGKLLGERQYVLLVHNGWEFNENRAILFPLGGMLDAVIRDLPSDRRATAFPVAASPFKDVAVSPEFKNDRDKPLALGDICDAYMLNGQLADYRFSTLEAGTIDQALMEKISRARGVDPSEIKTKKPSEFIDSLNEQITKYNRQFADLPR